MASILKEISPTQRELRISIDADVLRDAYARASKKYAANANVPGFRKGNAPLDVVRLRYQEEIRNEVLQQVVPPKVAEAINEHDLHPLAEPELHIDDAENIRVNGTQPLEMHVHVEVMPDIPVPNYKGLEIVRRRKPVPESQVDDLIAERLQQHAALIPVEGRRSEEGDTVIVDLEGKFDDDPDGEPITAEDLEIVLGDEVIEKAFTENLLGVEPDEEKDFTVSYPAEFSSPALAGKTVHYKAKVKTVGRAETPELSDEWAVSLDEGYESLADLRQKLQSDLERYSEMDADARLRNNAIAKLIEENAFEVPNSLIESQARNLLNNFARDLQQRGVNLDRVENEFIQMAYSQMRAQAERDVQGAMLLEKIAEVEAIEVADAEVDEEIAKLAEHYKVSPDEVRKSLEKQGGTASIANNIRTRKAIEALVANAAVTEGDWIDESAAAATAGDEEPKKAAKKRSGTAKKRSAATEA
jgi:trigger factor